MPTRSSLAKGGPGEHMGVHAAEKPQDQPHQGQLLPLLALSRGNHTLKVTLIQRTGSNGHISQPGISEQRLL